jgi:hypothetical protein
VGPAGRGKWELGGRRGVEWGRMHKWEVGSGVGNRGEEGRVLEGKKRIKEMIDGLADAIKAVRGTKMLKQQ